MASAGLLFVSQGCVEIDPCEDYVTYMCDCHGGDADVDCATLEATYSGASSELQDECTLALEDQEIEDLESGYSCSGSDDTDPPS